MRKFIISLMRAVALAYLPVILILPILMEDADAVIKFPYILVFLILLLYTVPFFVVYLEICSLTAFFLEKKDVSPFQRSLKIIGAVLLCGTLVSVIFINKLPALCFTLVGVLFAVMLIEAIAKIKSKEAFAWFKDGRAWLFALIIAAIVSGIFLGISNAEQGENKPDPEAPVVCIRI